MAPAELMANKTRFVASHIESQTKECQEKNEKNTKSLHWRARYAEIRPKKNLSTLA